MYQLFLWFYCLPIPLALRTEHVTAPQPDVIPFHSYYTALTGGSRELYRANLMNVILFFPAGLPGCALLPGRLNMDRRVAMATCVFAVLSISIECSQYWFGLGFAEVDDVIHNTPGALLGSITCSASIGFPKT